MCKRAICLMGLFLVLAAAGSIRAELVAHWKLDETTGLTARDSSGNGYDGTLVGGATWIVGNVDGALEVNGSTGYVDFGNPQGWPAGRSPRSLCGWGRSDSIASGYRWMAAYGTAGTGQAMFIGMNGNSMICGGYNGDDVTVAGTWRVGEWCHVGLTYDGTTARAYANGVEVGSMAKNWNLVLNRAFLGEQVNAARELWDGAIDDVRLYDHVLTLAELPEIMAGQAAEPAKDPIPEDEAVDVRRDAVVSWTAGEFAATHDVYFGTTFDDVNTAGRGNPMGVLASQGQTATEYDPDGLLVYGQTYYWRVDEVNAAPDNTIFKGETWSFTAEPFSYPVTPVAATASSAQPGMGPQNTINRSGLNDNDEHSTELTQMWMSSGAPQPNWIQYEFDKVYKLDQLWVWNSNQLIEAFLGFGAKDVTIEYSTDSETWTALEGVPQFTRAPGTPTYRADISVDFGGALAQFVKLTINANWGGVAPQTGLSEVRFFYVPVQAFAPQPADDATGVSIDTALDWRPGREAGSHDVYFGTDESAMVLVDTVAEHGYTPASLDFASEYFWKVNEVNATGSYEGEVWSFTTQEYATVDDFESYNDDDNRIYNAWIDGLTDQAKGGSQVGYDASPFAEKTIVHGGAQSMPLRYDNTAAPFFSEAQRTFDTPQDWAARGIKTLSIHFSGVSGNSGQLYVKINDTKVAYDGEAADLARVGWQAWNIDLSAIGNGSSVRALTIGVEGSGTTGTLYLDDIRLSPKALEFITPVEPDSANLVGHYTFDEGSGTRVGDSSGKGHHGTVNGTPEWVAGPPGRIGGAMEFGGDGDWVDLGNPTDWPAGAEARSLCVWARAEDVTANWHWIAAYGSGATSQAMFIGLNGAALYGGGYGNDLSVSNFWEIGVWHHLALTYDGVTARLYADGVELASAAKDWNLVRSRARIGQQVNDLNEFWDGAVDDVRIYSETLSVEEIAWLAGRSATGGPIHKPL